MKKIILIVLTVITLMLSACSNAAVVKEKPVSFSNGNKEITTQVTVPSTMKAVTKEMTTELKTTVTTTKKDEQTVTQNTTTKKSTTTKKQTTTKKAEKTTKKTEKTTKKPTTTKKKETTTKKQTTTKAKTCTNNGNHSLSCGNMGRWFNSKSEVKAYVDKEMKYWADLEESGKITREEYYKKCPSGYECWSCSYCGKWTGNFKY